MAWSIVIGSSAIILGALSVTVYVRRLLFAAAGTPHSAFFAAALAVIISHAIGGNTLLWSVLLGVGLVYLLGYLAYLGLDPDDATSIVVALSTSGGAISLYYVLTHYAYSSSILGIIIGDPLLATSEEITLSVIIMIFIIILLPLTINEITYIGIDREDARLSGMKVWAYDLALYTILGISIAGLVRVIGFIIEHVLVLLPGAIAASRGRSPMEALLMSVSITLLAGGLGLIASLWLDLSPAGLIGLITLAFYAVHVFIPKR
jgi:zinc/manganese transport system permease protein